MAEELKEEKINTKKVEKKIETKKVEEPMVPIYVPIDPLNPKVKYVEVYVQDRKFRLPRNKTIMVPPVVKQIIEESLNALAELDIPEVEGLKYDGQEV